MTCYSPGMVLRRKTKVNKGRWQLHRERCSLDESAEPEEPLECSGLAEIIKKVLADTYPPGSKWLMELERDWGAIVGGTVAQHTRPGRLDGKLLFVYVDSAVWLNELKRFGEETMLQKIRARFGEDNVTALRLVPDPGHAH